MTHARPGVHRVARGFDRVAADYERGRPEYPPAALRFLARTFGLGPGRTIVELGSGTGKLTRGLVPFGAAVVAVEPSAPMRRQFAAAVPGVLCLAGTAEAIPLPDDLADLVVAAQAFHWFRPRTAVRAIARVLRSRGGLALLWNSRDPHAALARRLDALVDRHAGTRPRRWSRWKAPFDSPVGPFGRLHYRTYRRVVPTPRAALVQQILSVSRVGMLPPARRAALAREVRSLLDRDPISRGRRSVPMPTITELYWTRRRR